MKVTIWKKMYIYLKMKYCDITGKKMLKEYPNNIKQRYNLSSEIDNETEIVSILDKIGAKIGAVRNNETNYDKVYATIIKDLREGYLGKITFDNISC